jgi:hypothetical protein
MNKWLNNMLLNLVILAAAIAVGVAGNMYVSYKSSQKRTPLPPSSSTANNKPGEANATKPPLPFEAELDASNKSPSPPAWAKVLKEIVSIDVMASCILQNALATKDGSASKRANPLSSESLESSDVALEGMSKRFGSQCTLYKQIENDFELTVKAMKEKTLSNGEYYVLSFYNIDLNQAEEKTGWFVTKNRCEIALDLAFEAGMAAKKCTPIKFNSSRRNNKSYKLLLQQLTK